MSRLQLNQWAQSLEHFSPFPISGYVTNVSGILVEGTCTEVPVGALCEITSLTGNHKYQAEVVGFRDEKVLLMPLQDVRGIGRGSRISFLRESATVKLGVELVGRVVDPLMNPVDGGPAFDFDEEFSIYAPQINPLKRDRIREPLDLGVRSINGLLTIGKGQRMGIMAGSGVGKSMLLGMMARNTTADVNIIALIGERGREVREFIERDLGEAGMARSVVVVATGDSSPLIRMRAAYVATTMAEYFRKKGADVMLMMDSITRFCMSQREIGLSAGEPPTTKGYPPSVFTTLPKLLERAGNLTSGGSITGIYTVLIEGDDINDPIGDAVRSIVDGHLFLSRKMAAKSQFPAIDVGNSTSRVMSEVADENHFNLASRVKAILATYAEAEDLISIGAYVKGSNPAVDEALHYIQPIRDYLKQDFRESARFDESLQKMHEIFMRHEQAGRR